MKKKTSLESKLRRKHTRIKVRDYGIYREYAVILEIGPQSFNVTPISLTDKQEAEWFRTMLAKALAQIVKENK